MRVTRIDTFAVAVPHERPIRLSSRRRVEALLHVLVRVHTDVGIEGVGFAFRLTMQDIGPLLRTTEMAARAIMGIDPTRPETARESLQQHMTLDGSDELASMPASALDIALWDITGKAAGLCLSTSCWATPGTGSLPTAAATCGVRRGRTSCARQSPVTSTPASRR